MREVPGCSSDNNDKLRHSYKEGKDPKDSEAHEINHISGGLTPSHGLNLISIWTTVIDVANWEQIDETSYPANKDNPLDNERENWNSYNSHVRSYEVWGGFKNGDWDLETFPET